MKTIQHIIVVFIILLFPAGSLIAQIEGASESRSGSFYSLFGVGIPTDNTHARALGMGIIGVSLDNAQSNSLHNPALWGKNSLTTASSGFNLSRFQASDQFSKSSSALLEAGYIQVTLPIYRERVGASVAMYPVTRSNYRFVNFDSTASGTDDVVNYASDIRGTGGVNKLELGLGWNINNNIAVGYAPSLTFISHNSSTDVFFNRSGYETSNLDSKITGTAFGHRFGALFTFRNLTRKSDRLSLGVSATLPISIEGKKNTTVDKVIASQEQEVSLKEAESGEVNLPLALKAGLSYYPTGLVNFSVEGLFEQWSEYESSFNQNAESFAMSDRYKIGLGGEYHPYRLNSSNILSKLRYSGGVSFDSGHLTIRNKDINTLWFSTGFGIISPRSNSTVDLSIRYGLRGTTANDLVREKIWAFNLSVNLSELMFFRQKLN